jgi:hypothetical protein
LSIRGRREAVFWAVQRLDIYEGELEVPLFGLEDETELVSTMS